MVPSRYEDWLTRMLTANLLVSDPGLQGAYARAFPARGHAGSGKLIHMAALGLAAGGLLVLAMIALSLRGWRTLPADARVPIRHGFRSYGNYQSKKAGLVAWPAAGIVIYGLYSGVFVEALSTHSGNGGMFLLPLPVGLLVLTAVQIGAIRAAGRTSGRDNQRHFAA